jgi:hypothetical protein
MARRLHVLLALAALVAFALPAACGDDQAPSAPDRPGERGPAKAAERTPRPAFAVLSVNGRRAPTLAAGLPLYVTLSLANPLERPLAVSGLDGLRPRALRRSDGAAVQAAWQGAGPVPSGGELPPGGVLRLVWALPEGMPQGGYVIGLAAAGGLLADGAGAVLRAEPALLQVTPGPPAPARAAAARRRILALAGDAAGWLAAVDQALADSPQDGGLRLERSRALEAAGRPDRALAELKGLTKEIQQRFSDGQGRSSAHFPSWWLADLARLERAARARGR